jgi:hypothetical protein
LNPEVTSMRRFLILGAALLLAVPQLRADIGPRPGGPRPQPFPVQPAKTKITIEVDEKATEPRLLVPIQLMLGGGIGAFGVGGGVGGGFAGVAGAGGAAGFGGAIGVGGGAVGAIGNPPANFGAFGAAGQVGGLPGAAGQKGGNPPAGLLGGAPQAPPPVVVPPGGQDEDPATEQEPESKRQSSLPLSTMIIGLALTLSFSTGGLWMARRKTGSLGGSKPLGVLVALLAIGLLGGAAVWANRAPPVRPPAKPPAQPAVPGPLPTLLKMEGIKVEFLPQGDTVRLILTKKQKETIKGKDSTAPVEKPAEK